MFSSAERGHLARKACASTLKTLFAPAALNADKDVRAPN